MDRLGRCAVVSALWFSLIAMAGASSVAASPVAAGTPTIVGQTSQIVDARFIKRRPTSVRHRPILRHYLKHPVKRRIVRRRYVRHPHHWRYRRRHYYARRHYGPGPAVALSLFGAALGAVIANSGPDYDDYGYGYGYPVYGYGYPEYYQPYDFDFDGD